MTREDILDVVCGLCHWPYVYRDQDTVRAEKCDYCPATAAVRAALGKEAGTHDDGTA